MATDILISVIYLVIARWVVLKTKVPLLRSILGPFLGGILISFMGIGIIEDSFESFMMTVPACLYLVYISGKEAS